MSVKRLFSINFFATVLGSEIFVYITKRILQGVLTLLGASILCFLVIKLAPGDYLTSLKLNNPKISQETLLEIKKQFGLDQSIFQQYWNWLTQILTKFNFGYSFVYSRSVSSLLIERVPATILLALSSLLLTWSIALPFGILSAVKQNTFADKFLRILSYIWQGFPPFITGLLLLILAQNVSPLFPVGNMKSLDYDQLTLLSKILDIGWHLILPTIALSISSFAGLQRLMRGQLLDVLRQEYIQTARAKGLPEKQVIYRHALRNAINPLITLLGFEFASLLGGAFIAENLFNWPGLGRLILQAVTSNDLYLVMASLMMGALMLILGNILADILLKLVDPRIQFENN
jgi:peptide/nickel transport system permease protein